MSKKDYIAIAAIWMTAIKAELAEDNIQGVDVLCNMAASLATVLRRDNPNFDRARFMAACGVED